MVCGIVEKDYLWETALITPRMPLLAYTWNSVILPPRYSIRLPGTPGHNARIASEK
jgi:hypothetical protein